MSQNHSNPRQKDVSLEAIRGLAAIVVVFSHCCLAFAPQHAGLFPQYTYYNWQSYPLFFLINGDGAVSLFFVLSGYVLTRRYFLSGNSAIILRGAIKRWPRLMGPVLVTVIISYVLFVAGCYNFEAAAQVSGSPWLTTLVTAYPYPFPSSLLGAFQQGMFLVFFRGDHSYDSSLWTMRPEFIGSLVAFGMAPILYEAKKLSVVIVILLALCVALLAHYAMPNLVSFPAGVAIAAILPNDKAMPTWAAYLILPLALYLMGYNGTPIGAYSIFSYLPFQGIYRAYVATAGSVLIICLVESFLPIRKCVSGSLSRWLGEFSFPIYLMHLLIICSVGSTVYLLYGAALATISVAVATPIAAFPLLVFNRKWVSGVNRAAETVINRAHKETNSLTETVSHGS